MTNEEVIAYRDELDGIKIRVRAEPEGEAAGLADGPVFLQGQHCPRPIKRWTQCGLNMKMCAVPPCSWRAG